MKHQQDIRRIDAVLDERGPSTPVDVYEFLVDAGRLLRYMSIPRIGAVMRRHYPKLGKTPYRTPRGYRSGGQTSNLYGPRVVP